MTTERLRHLLAAWCQSEDAPSEDLSEIRSLTDFLEQVLYHEYEPASVGAQGDFAARLARWIGSAETDQDMRSLYLLLGRLVFFGREQMMAGYRTAYSRNIALWLMEIEGLPFFGADTEARVQAAVTQTAFTEITDSFRLGDFLRWNNVAGHGTRYTWEQTLGGMGPRGVHAGDHADEFRSATDQPRSTGGFRRQRGSDGERGRRSMHLADGL